MPQRPSLPRPPIFLALVAVIAFLPLLACGKGEGGGGGGAQGGGQMPPARVTVVTLKSEPVTLSRELPGRTTPVMEAEVRPQVNGIVERRLFSEGGIVRAGQPLYELDDAVYRAEYENARAALAKAEARAQAARLAAQRADQLRKIDAVSEQEKEDAVAGERAAAADVAAGRAMVERNRLNLRYARIASPITGRVGMSTVTAGALVTANQDAPLATVQQLDPIYVDATQSSSEWLRVRREIASGEIAAGDAGTPVTIVLEDGSRYAHPGKLQATDAAIDEGTGSFALRILVPNPEYVLRPGMYVTAVLAEAKDANAILAPQQGITRDPKGNASAMVVGPDGKVALRQVKVSRTIGDKWLVDEGLAAGDRVIVEGLQKVQPGMPATAVELGSAPPPPAAGPGQGQKPPASE